MYNHYIPQSDGSYRRSTMPERQRQQRPSTPPRQKPTQEELRQPEERHKEEEHCQPEEVCHRKETAPQSVCEPPRQHDGVLSFLKGLLPREIDAADLMVIFLLLLMNREDCDDSFSPMLTIALYFLL